MSVWQILFWLCIHIINECISIETITDRDRLNLIRDRIDEFGREYGFDTKQLHQDAVEASKPYPSSLDVVYWDDEQFEDKQIVIVPQEINSAFDRFVEHFIQNTDPESRNHYKDKNYYALHMNTGYRLIEKCITKRAIVFMNTNDLTLLRDNSQTTSHPDWTHLGTKAYETKEQHFSIMNYLSYDEMQLSAFLLVAGMHLCGFLDRVTPQR